MKMVLILLVTQYSTQGLGPQWRFQVLTGPWHSDTRHIRMAALIFSQCFNQFMLETTTYARDIPQVHQLSTSTQQTHTAFDASSLNKKQSATTARMALTIANSAMQGMMESAKRWTSGSKQKTTSLMDMPAEVRGLILNEVFAQATLTAEITTTNLKPPLECTYTTANRSLFYVCKTLRTEAIPILLRSTTFVFRGYTPSPNLSEIVPKEVLEGVTRVVDRDQSLFEAPLADFSAFPRLEEVVVNRIDSLISIAKTCDLDFRRLRSDVVGKGIADGQRKVLKVHIENNMGRKFRELHKLPEKIRVDGRLAFHAPYPDEVASLDLGANNLTWEDCDKAARCAAGLCRKHRRTEPERQV